MTRLLRLFPKSWRAAYGQEVADMLASSTRPWRDRLDLVRAAVGVRAQQLRDQLQDHERTTLVRLLRALAIGLVALGLGGAGWATTQLASGIVEIPMHWWSTLAVLPLPAGILLAVIAWWPRRRHDQLA